MTGGGFCHEYGNVRADVVNVTHALERITEKLRREHALSDDGAHDPDWEVHVDHRVIEKLLTFLGGVHGLLWHLGNEPRAAEALLIAHKGETWGEAFLAIAAANAATEEGAPANE